MDQRKKLCTFLEWECISRKLKKVPRYFLGESIPVKECMASRSRIDWQRNLPTINYFLPESGKTN